MFIKENDLEHEENGFKGFHIVVFFRPWFRIYSNRQIILWFL